MTHKEWRRLFSELRTERRRIMLELHCSDKCDTTMRWKWNRWCAKRFGDGDWRLFQSLNAFTWAYHDMSKVWPVTPKPQKLLKECLFRQQASRNRLSYRVKNVKRSPEGT